MIMTELLDTNGVVIYRYWRDTVTEVGEVLEIDPGRGVLVNGANHDQLVAIAVERQTNAAKSPPEHIMHVTVEPAGPALP